jgi:hypothetical protein
VRGDLAVESETVLDGEIVSLPIERFDHSHHPMTTATTSTRKMSIHGAPRFLSSSCVSATLVALVPGVLVQLATSVPFQFPGNGLN